MSQIHVLNHIADNKEYYTYILESHGELTLIIEKNNSIKYAEILGLMVTHNTKNKSVKQIVDNVKNYISECADNNQ